MTSMRAGDEDIPDSRVSETHRPIKKVAGRWTKEERDDKADAKASG